MSAPRQRWMLPFETEHKLTNDEWEERIHAAEDGEWTENLDDEQSCDEFPNWKEH